MRHDVLDRLRHENPVPETMAALPIEPVLRRLNDAPQPMPIRPRIRGRGRPRGLRPRLAQLAPVAALLIVVAVVAVFLGVQDRKPPRSTAPQNSGTAASLHLWIGSPGGVVPPTELGPKQYWYVRTLGEEQLELPLERGSHPLLVSATQDLVIERWIGRTGQASRAVQTPAGPLRFANAIDQAKWKAGGSLNPYPSALRRVPDYTYGLTGFGTPAELSYRDVQHLLTGPRQLIEQIQARLKAEGALGGRADRNPMTREADLAALTTQTVLTLLETPAPANVHAALAAAARQLAGSNARPGTDPIGRHGTVLKLSGGNKILVIDPASGALLADTLTDSPVNGLNTYLAAGLVNSSTALPHGFPVVTNSH